MIEFQINGVVEADGPRLTSTSFGSTVVNGNVERFARVSVTG
ncbi:MAG: hypothetical protein SFY92_11250 [Verrucomicrobiae bacterium]|nr:hypothetical protein [Verrucomicrobiae bacterium]